jgi:hypothetical protein
MAVVVAIVEHLAMTVALELRRRSTTIAAATITAAAILGKARGNSRQGDNPQAG